MRGGLVIVKELKHGYRNEGNDKPFGFGVRKDGKGVIIFCVLQRAFELNRLRQYGKINDCVIFLKKFLLRNMWGVCFDRPPLMGYLASLRGLLS